MTAIRSTNRSMGLVLVDPFFFASGDPLAYEAAFPTCDPLLAYKNADGAVNGGDIDAFFEALSGG